MKERDWRRAILGLHATLHQAIQTLVECAMQIVLVTSPDGRLLGTLTDGDIRRGLLRGLDLDSSIESVINREPLVAPPQLGRDAVLHLMQANRIHQLPIVDDSRHVIGLHVWDDLVVPARRGSSMVIMAGGLGTRLRPLTETCPKPMLLVAGRPMLEHIIERAKGEGFSSFVIAVNYLGHVIEEYFGDGSQWHVQITYVREESPLGTAGAVGLLAPRPDGPFVVSNGDVVADVRYGELLDFHVRHGAAATMAVRLYEWQHPFGVVRIQGLDIAGFEEKPVVRGHINAGIYVLEPMAIDSLAEGEPCDMPTLFERLKERGERTIAYPMHEPWLDVGRADDLNRANELNSDAR